MSETPARPLYVLFGTDAYLRRQKRQEIVRRFAGGAETAFVVTHFDASAELSEVLDELRTAPFLAPRRLVVVHEADEFVGTHRQRLEKYFSSPSQTGSLMLLVDAWPANTRLAGLARRIGEVIDCSSPHESKLPRWISEAADARGKRIARDASALLMQWIGPDLARLDSELEKLSLYVGARASITLEDVSRAVAATAGPAPFALINAIRAGDAGEALAVLNLMLTRRGEEFRLLGLLGWYLRQRRAGPRRAWAGRSAVPGPARQSPSDHGGFRRLLGADLAIKTGADPLATIQVLVTRLCT